MVEEFSKEKQAALEAIAGLNARAKKNPGKDTPAISHGDDEPVKPQASKPAIAGQEAPTAPPAPPVQKPLAAAQHAAPAPAQHGHGGHGTSAPNQKLQNAAYTAAAAVNAPSSVSYANSINEIFAYARSKNASDVHLCMNNPIMLRAACKLASHSQDTLNAQRMEALCREAFPPYIIEKFMEHGDAEFVHTVGKGRYRITLTKERFGWDLTARLIPETITTIEAIGLPKSCANLTKWAQGLVLVTGPAGCGKSTTMSALVELVNQTRHDHIITIENPIEFVYEPKSCQITQREINTHTLSQHNALRAALREDPDILVISELRDLESIQLAVTAAETGHLVFGTMDTINASQTVSRIIDSFPADEQSVIRNMISESLRGVICQQLVPKMDGSGVVPAFEVLVVNSAVGNLIRMNKVSQIITAITTGKSAGMVLLDHSLEELMNKRIISGQEAYERAVNPQIFEAYR